MMAFEKGTLRNTYEKAPKRYGKNYRHFVKNMLDKIPLNIKN